MNAKQLREHVAKSCGFTPNKAKQGEIPDSFEAWLKSNQDSIDIGGNWTPDRVEANKAQYDKLPF